MASMRVSVESDATELWKQKWRRWTVFIGSGVMALAIVAVAVKLRSATESVVIGAFVVAIGVVIAWSGVVLMMFTVRPAISEVTAPAGADAVKGLAEIGDIIEALSKLTPAVAVTVIGTYQRSPSVVCCGREAT